MHGPRVLRVSRVQGARGFEEQHAARIVGHGPMLDAARDDQELSGLELDYAVAQFHAEPAFDHEEEFILALVLMPDEFAVQLGELHLAIIDVADDPRRPDIGELRQFVGRNNLGQHGGLHTTLSATMRAFIGSIEAEFRRYKALAEGAIRQLDDAQLEKFLANEESNSVATLVRNIAGNLKSRFSEFLTSDGEKPWRNRDGEFERCSMSRVELLEHWEDGWRTLCGSLALLADGDLTRTVMIRGQPLAVHEALHRSLAHASYHVGQIVSLARAMRGSDWQFMSIPPGRSAEYNKNPGLEKGPRTFRERP
jgi:hypothetical protein